MDKLINSGYDKERKQSVQELNTDVLLGISDPNMEKRSLQLKKKELSHSAKEAENWLKEEKELLKKLKEIDGYNSFKGNNIDDIKEYGVGIQNFDKKADIPSEFKNCGILMYENLIKEHKSVPAFLVSQLKGIFGENNKILGIIENMMPDWKDESSEAGIVKTIDRVKKIKEFLQENKDKWYMPTKLIETILPKIDSLYKKGLYKLNNYKEEEYFVKKGYIFNTETIWLYSNKPENLSKYSIENFSKAPNTEGRNQVTSRLKFVEVLKNTNVSDINSKGLVDYFYKSKIKYGNWEDAISKIYDELGNKKMKEIIAYMKQENPKVKGTEQAFRKFINENKDIVDLMGKYNDFSKEEKIGDDLKILSKNIKTRGVLIYKVAKSIKAIKDGEILESNKTKNVLEYVHKKGGIDNPMFKENINQLAFNLLKKGNYKKFEEGLNNSEASNMVEKPETLQDHLGGIAHILDKYHIDIEKLPNDLLKDFKEKIVVDPGKAADELGVYLLNNKELTANKFIAFANDILKLMGKNYKKLADFVKVDLASLIKSKNIDKKQIKALLEKMPQSDIEKNILSRYLTILENDNKGNKKLVNFLKILKYHLKNPEMDMSVLESAISSTWNQGFSDLGKINLSGVGKAAEKSVIIAKSEIEANEKTRQEVTKQLKQAQDSGKQISVDDIKAIKEQELQKDPEGKKIFKKLYKAKAELAQTGYYTKEEKQEIYESIYYSSFLDDDFKNQVKQQAEKEGIKLDIRNKIEQNQQINQLNTSSSIDEVFDSDNKVQLNKKFDYKQEGGLVKIENPFKTNELESDFIEGKDTKDVNSKLLLSYFNAFGFYQADELLFSKDTQKVYEQFGIDITTPLSLSDIQKFTQILAGGVIYQLEKNKNLSSIHKKYISNFKKRIQENPNDTSVYKELIMFLNDNIDVFMKTGFYDYTEKRLDFDNFLNKEKDPKFKNYLKDIKIIPNI